ncbi:MAG: DUF3857 domain-containing transglutaminase family protein, partial [Gemmatimonadales bacterium]
MKVCEMSALCGVALSALLSGWAAPASGQAPTITPAGDPSVRNDTIYGLAVDPTQYADQPFVYLLDDGVVRFEADGRGSRTFRQVIQILTREAAETWGEQSFSYTSGRERLTVNWVRVVRPNGQVVSAKPVHEQESIAPVAQESPVFSDVKVRRVSLGGVAPGTIVDYSYTVETLKPIMPGDYYTGWRVTTGRLTRRSRFILDIPAAVSPVIKEANLGFARHVQEGRGRRVYTWATSEIPVLESEPFASDSNGLVGRIEVAAPNAWGDVARWYAGLAHDRYAVPPDLEAHLKEVVTGARTLEDSIRAVHRWVAQDFRYVSLSLGIGGFQPRPPASVYETRYGDCKDKATLFIALAQRLGVRAYPVLLSSTGGVDRSLPSGRQFDHMIAAIERSGGYLYLDLTADLTPFGALPPAEQGEFGLLVHPDGRGEEVTFPSDSLTANRTEVRIVGELSADGGFVGRFTRTASGSEQYGLRGSLASSPQMSATDSSKVSRVIANGVFEGASGDSLELFNGRDLRAEPRVSLVVRSSRIISNAGTTDILNLPLDSYTSAS